MKHSQIIEILDKELSERLIPANDNHNYNLSNLSMEDFEAGSVLNQRDYTRPNWRNEISLIAACGICALVLIVAFVLPLLK